MRLRCLPAGEREEAAFATYELVFELAFGLRLLLEAGAPRATVVRLRVQFESLIRAAWLLHAATQAQLEKLAVPLTPETAAAAKNIPGADKILTNQLAAMETAPGLRGPALLLKELKDSGWTVMDAFTHSGLDPIVRTQEGLLVHLATDVVKLSNGVLLAVGAPGGSSDIVQRVEPSYEGFTDVPPLITPSA